MSKKTKRYEDTFAGTFAQLHDAIEEVKSALRSSVPDWLLDTRTLFVFWLLAFGLLAAIVTLCGILGWID